ncbi:MAG: acetate--CoA ligase family protein [Candidatus Hydrothermarchaeaceae archaeon]
MVGIKKQLDPFFSPKSVAIIGATTRTGPAKFNVVENMIWFGYDGEIYPVNPKYDEVLGRKAYKDVRDVEGDVDLALIVIPRQIVPNAVKGCAEKGVKAVIVVSQGFGEVGEEGKKFQDEIVKIAKETGMRIVGPNTLGTNNFFDNFTSSFIPIKKRDYDPIGVSCQTGLWFAGFPRLRYGKVIDVGGACDVDHVDALRYYIEDPDIKQIFIHMEGLRPGRGRDFLEAARKAKDEGKDVIVMKVGETEAGRRAVVSHTGSLAGEDKVFDGALQQVGVPRIRDYTELQILSHALLKLPRMNGNRITVLTHHGESGVMSVDAAEEFGLKISEISEETKKVVQELSPQWLPIGNPVDIWPGLMKDPKKMHMESLKAVLEDENVDGALMSLHIADYSPWDVGIYGHTEAIRELAPKYEKPVIVVPVGTEQEGTRRALEWIKNVAVFDDIRAAFRAFSALAPKGMGEQK